MPLARSVRGDASASMRLVEVDGADDQGACGRVGDVRRGVRRLLGPAVEAPDEAVVRSTIAVEPALAVHPVELLGHQEQRGDRRGVVGLVLRASCRSRSAGRRRPGSSGRWRRSRRRARARRATSARSRARRRRRSTSAARSSRRRPRRGRRGRPPAPEVASTSDQGVVGAGRADDRGHHAGRGLVVGPGVDVDALLGRRRTASEPGSLAITDGAASHGAAAAAVANFAENSPKRQVLALLADQAEGRDVPERGGAAVAEHDLVAVGQREQLRRGRRGRDRRASRTGACRCEVPISEEPVRGQRVEVGGVGSSTARRRSVRRRASGRSGS